jgi:UDP-N-acetyl-D-glucosamine dehydrogenase
MESVELTENNLQDFELILLSTDHDDYDYEFIIKNSKLVIDTRNAFRKKGIQSDKLYDA